MNNIKKRLLERAFKHPYLGDSINNIALSDKKEVSDYTIEELVEEVEYCLTTYFEDGHINNPDSYDAQCEFERDERKSLLKERSQLKRIYLDYKKFSNNKWSNLLPF
jgi:hypothetical protein